MFLRMVTHAIRKEALENSAETYNTSIMPALGTTKGCVFASFLQSTSNPQECISFTIWNSQKEFGKKWYPYHNLYTLPH